MSDTLRLRLPSWSRRVWLLGVSSLVLAVGCGPQFPPCYPVAGKVQWKGGKTFTQGNISMVSKENPEVVAIGEIGKDGSFTVSTKLFGQSKEGAPEGEYTIMVEDPARNVAPDGQMQIKPMVVTTSSFKVEPKDANNFTVEVVQ